MALQNIWQVSLDFARMQADPEVQLKLLKRLQWCSDHEYRGVKEEWQQHHSPSRTSLFHPTRPPSERGTALTRLSYAQMQGRFHAQRYRFRLRSSEGRNGHLNVYSRDRSPKAVVSTAM